MPVNALKIYRSSAGSGKTFTLVREYIRLVLMNPAGYRNILAITFTNEAAREMKDRVISALVSLSQGKGGALKEEMEKEFNHNVIAEKAKEALSNILHDYSAFSVSTIDSFFQKLLRSLAREIHLPPRLQIQVGIEDAIIEVTQRLMRDIGKDKDLTQWLTEMVLRKLEEDKGWNIEGDIEAVAREMFREYAGEKGTLTKNKIRDIVSGLHAVCAAMEKEMQSTGNTGLNAISAAGLEISDFAHRDKGVSDYFRKISLPPSSAAYIPSKRTLAAVSDPSKWFPAKSDKKELIQQLAESTLIPLLQKAIAKIESEGRNYFSAKEALKRIYMFGIINDLSIRFSEYRNENNTILLADTTRLLSNLISDDDAPFIYEKAGNRYNHLLIDEFQDTSALQWKSLLPLIINSLGSGNLAMLVGDVKQSIYRWRGGNLKLLLNGIRDDLKQFRDIFMEDSLSMNFRSKKAVVEFNNAFFSKVPFVFENSEETKMNLVADAYSQELIQKISKSNLEGGYVRVESIGNGKEDGNEEKSESVTWKEVALKKLYDTIISLRDKNYRLGEMAILVRKNEEGNEVANFLMENGIHNIISPDSLLIRSAPRIRFLLNIMKFLTSPDDAIARTDLLYYYLRYIAGKATDLHRIFSDHKIRKKSRKNPESALFDASAFDDNLFNTGLPEAFTAHIPRLAKLPVYELSEQLISIFNLNVSPDAYIQRFQDLVLDFSTSDNSNTARFISWFEESRTAQNCSVLIPENDNAIRILTIHKSKGLQFPVVLIPFASWPLTPKANELLWVSSDQMPYREMGMVAVLSSKNLLQTWFSDSYSDEITQSVIDNLNLLYVAFTRAEQQLYVWYPEGNTSTMNSVSKLIEVTLRNISSAATMPVYTAGNAEMTGTVQDKAGKISVPLSEYPVHSWSDRISIASRSKDLVEITGNDRQGNRNFGILVHRILAEIQYRQDSSRALARAEFEGIVNREEAEILRNSLTSLFENKEISSFFDPGWQVLNERDILLPGGEILRPDRVIFSKTQTKVIDFKTGKDHPGHRQQVQQYASVLSQMGYPGVEAWLVYLQGEKVLKAG